MFGSWAIWTPDARARAMREIHRVVRTGGEIWAVENHWDSDFKRMPGTAEQDGDHQSGRWYAAHGFQLIERIATAFAFPSLAEAERVLGFIGEHARQNLAQHPSPRLGHRAMILRKEVART